MQTRNVYSEEQLREVLWEMVDFIREHDRIVIKFDKAPRSIPQNDTFHMWCAEFAQAQTERGKTLDPETAKLWFKHLFLGYENIQMGTREIENQLRSTKNLSMGEFYWFMERVWEYSASEHHIFLTIPSESQFQKLRDKQNG